MGGNLSFEAADSPSTPGQQSILSSEIPGVDDASKLLEAIEKYVKAGKAVHPMAADSCVTDKDGGILVKEVFKSLIGEGEFVHHSLFKIDAADSTVKIHFFPTEFLHERDEPMCTNFLKVLTGPVRIEFWQDAHEVRTSGKLLREMLNKALDHFGAPKSAKADQPAIGDAGKFSVVSEPITTGKATAENYFACFKEFLVDEMGSTDLPDGTVVEERSVEGLLAALPGGDVFSGKHYAKHVFKSEEDHLYCHEFGDDESMTNEIGVTHVQVHRDPFRLEQWSVQKAQRMTGKMQQDIVEKFVNGVLKFMQAS